MPHAVVRIAESCRERLEQAGLISIRSNFVGLVARCIGYRVVLYQSARQADRSNVTVGYFATVIVDEVIVLPDDHLHADIRVSKVEPLDRPKILFAGESAIEPDLFTPSGKLKGWSAAYDVREISIQQYRDITDSDAQAPFTVSPGVVVTTPRFQNHVRQIRDPEFRLMVYRAYGGRCATVAWN